MTDFTVTISDADGLLGITWAREQYNASLPEDGEQLATDALYVQHVMAAAATSYADQKHRAEILAQL